MSNYRGRFAPSPTGPLHFGSLFAAVISYLHARAQGGKWLVRIEDLDPPREQADAKVRILNTLERHGLEWDESVVYQSQRSHIYEQCLLELAKLKVSYQCPCSRKYLSEHDGRHSEACRQQEIQNLVCASKFKAGQKCLAWADEFQGQQNLKLDEDFVLKRKEGLYAYQLAVVCDDIEQGINHVVRGYDLLESTPMQLALYQAFNQAPPIFSHFPVIVQQNGQKLSKQNRAPAVVDGLALANLLQIYHYLGLVLSDTPNSVAEAVELGLLAWKKNIPSILRQQHIIDSVLA